MAIDHGRADVYAAEIAAFEGTTYEQVVTLDELSRLSERLCASEWWPRGRIVVVPSRSDARSSSTLQHADEAPVIRLAAPQMTPATVVHELSHVLAGVGSGHGAVFRRAYIDLARAAFGAEPARWLGDQFEAHQLPLAARAWPKPPLHGGPIAV